MQRDLLDGRNLSWLNYHAYEGEIPCPHFWTCAISHTWFNKRKPMREGGGREEEKEKGNEQEFTTALRAIGGQAEASGMGVGWGGEQGRVSFSL